MTTPAIIFISSMALAILIVLIPAKGDSPDERLGSTLLKLVGVTACIVAAISSILWAAFT